MLRRRPLALLLVFALIPLLAACGEDEPARDAGPSDSLRLSATPDASMWDEAGTGDCPIGGGTPAAEFDGTTEATEGIEGVVAFGDPAADHVAGCVDYPVAPPVGGEHAQVWANCGFYTSAVPEEHAVHALEHGAVWIAFGTDLDAAAIDTIRDALRGTTHVLASPYPDLGTRVVLSAWSRQLTLDDVDDPRFAQFLETYVQGSQTPELGAPCSGALGGPAA